MLHFLTSFFTDYKYKCAFRGRKKHQHSVFFFCSHALYCSLVTVRHPLICVAPKKLVIRAFFFSFPLSLLALQIPSHDFGIWVGLRGLCTFVTLASCTAFIECLTSYAQQVDLYSSLAALNHLYSREKHIKAFTENTW